MLTTSAFALLGAAALPVAAQVVQVGNGRLQGGRCASVFTTLAIESRCSKA